MQQIGFIHLFGEMDLNLELSPKSVYKKACDISESCGYVTSLEKGTANVSRDRIEIFGEDFHDGFEVVSILYFEKNKFDKVQKCVYKMGYEGSGDNFKSFKQLTQVFEYVNLNWIETFNAKQLGIKMTKEYF